MWSGYTNEKKKKQLKMNHVFLSFLNLNFCLEQTKEMEKEKDFKLEEEYTDEVRKLIKDPYVKQEGSLPFIKNCVRKKERA
jgi:hypothetical protein